ncbi:hypothetical protein J5751_03420 [bacterium]|nr:hypothetical protein [bacterium]
MYTLNAPIRFSMFHSILSFSSDDVINNNQDSNAGEPASSHISFNVSSCAFTIRTIVTSSAFFHLGHSQYAIKLKNFLIHDRIFHPMVSGVMSKFLYNLSIFFFA